MMQKEPWEPTLNPEFHQGFDIVQGQFSGRWCFWTAEFVPKGVVDCGCGYGLSFRNSTTNFCFLGPWNKVLDLEALLTSQQQDFQHLWSCLPIEIKVVTDRGISGNPKQTFIWFSYLIYFLFPFFFSSQNQCNLVIQMNALVSLDERELPGFQFGEGIPYSFVTKSGLLLLKLFW